MIGRGDRAPAPTLTDRALFYAWCVFLERFATELDLPRREPGCTTGSV